MRNLVAGAQLLQGQARAEKFVKAADEAMKKNDVIGAANNYRLALEHWDDPFLRAKLEDVDVLAKTARIERALTRARAAEKERRWADAATHFEHALQIRRDAAVAERAAYAIYASGGDVMRALDLATDAVTMRAGNADYRITLGEVLLAANEPERAEEEARRALELMPGDLRAKELLKAIAKKKK